MPDIETHYLVTLVIGIVFAIAALIWGGFMAYNMAKVERLGHSLCYTKYLTAKLFEREELRDAKYDGIRL